MDPETTPAIAPANGTPAPAAPASPPGPAPIGITSEQLKERLAEEREKSRKALLAEIGFEKPEDLKTLVTTAKQRAEAEKTETERLTGRVKALEPLETEVAALREAVAAQAKDALAGLTESQRAAVVAVAGDSPAAQIKTIAALRPTWAGAPAAPAAPAAPPPPATTTPAGAAPAPAPSSSPTDHKAAYEALKTRNPVAAAQYLTRHRFEIYPAK